MIIWVLKKRGKALAWKSVEKDAILDILYAYEYKPDAMREARRLKSVYNEDWDVVKVTATETK